MEISMSEAALFIKMLKNRANECERQYYLRDDFGGSEHTPQAKRTLKENKDFLQEKYYTLKKKFEEKYNVQDNKG